LLSSVGAVDLVGRVALVTGGGRGMGRAIAAAFRQAGASVVVAARTATELAAVEAELPGVVGVRCDVAAPVEIDALFSAVDHRFGRLDALVCSHGVYTGVRSLLDIPLAEYEHTMAVNATGVFLCAQRAARLMIDGGDGGAIVAISSMNGLASQEGAADYDVSKTAVHGIVRSFAVELAPSGVTVNAIAPGWIRTAMSEHELRELEGMTLNPCRAVGEPDDIARAALWLIDPANRFVTGTVVTVDGGQTAMLPLPWREVSAGAKA
jgi:NAD(P)-dependent dehydrogenase (short-subunit alcohol dehydrogenase family)